MIFTFKKNITSSLFLILIFTTIVSCKKNYLEDGLTSLPQAREVNHVFKNTFVAKKVAFVRNGENKFKFIIKLPDNVIKKDVESYSLAIHVFSNSKEIKGKRKYNYNWDTKPVVETHGKHKYIITETEAPIKFIDSLNLFLYDRDKYKKKSYGKSLKIRNLGL